VVLTNTPRHNQVLLRQREEPPVRVSLEPRGRETVLLPLKNPYVFRGPDGDRFIYALTVRSRAGFIPAEAGESGDQRNLGCYVVMR
jgi:hypothetical protein